MCAQLARKKKGNYVRQSAKCKIGTRAIECIDLSNDDLPFEPGDLQILQGMQTSLRHEAVKSEHQTTSDAARASRSPARSSRPPTRAVSRSPQDERLFSMLDSLQDDNDDSPLPQHAHEEPAQGVAGESSSQGVQQTSTSPEERAFRATQEDEEEGAGAHQDTSEAEVRAHTFKL